MSTTESGLPGHIANSDISKMEDSGRSDIGTERGSIPPIDGVWTNRSTSEMTLREEEGVSKTAATGTVQLLTGDAPCKMDHPVQADKKATKVVSEYYKKQNDLLDAFKTDNEQIQEFQKTRSNQRLISTNSVEPEENATLQQQQPAAAETSEAITEEEDLSTPKQTGSGRRRGRRVPPEAITIEMRQIGEKKELLGVKTTDGDGGNHNPAATLLSKATLVVNVTLAILKAAASYWTGSLSIISSLIDSLVDITSGALIIYSTRAIKKRDPYSYPRGRTRLEPMTLVIISIVMGFASFQLMIESYKRIITQELEIDMDIPSACIMISTIVVKTLLVLICKRYSDPSIRVLAQDHLNDCLSNTVALICAGLSPRPLGDHYVNIFGMNSPSWLRYLDPIGAILVSMYIIRTWWGTGKEHLQMLIGKSAEPEFINRIIKVCMDHDSRIEHIDTVYVYHYGMKFLVEVHIVLDEQMPLKTTHDIAESLQINIESMPEVERAFVHTDYEYEHQPADEHKVV